MNKLSWFNGYFIMFKGKNEGKRVWNFFLSLPTLTFQVEVFIGNQSVTYCRQVGEKFFIQINFIW